MDKEGRVNTVLHGLIEAEKVYRQLYEEFDPDGVMAVHIEYDMAIHDGIDAVRDLIETVNDLVDLAECRGIEDAIINDAKCLVMSYIEEG